MKLNNIEVFLTVLVLSVCTCSKAMSTFFRRNGRDFSEEDIFVKEISDIMTEEIGNSFFINRIKRDLNDQFNLENLEMEQNDKLGYDLQDQHEADKTIAQLSNEQSDEMAEKNVKGNKENTNNGLPILQGGNIPQIGSEGNKEGGNIPFLQGGTIPQMPGDGGKEGGSIPFLPGGNIPQLPGGMMGIGQGLSQTPKLVWGGFFFVETPMPGASMSNIANMASLMQNGQQMIPGGGLPNPMMPTG